MSEQITTISFFRYTGFKSKLWALKMMQFGHAHLKSADGLSFYRLMGSGKNGGFNPFPDWSVYSLLQVWDNQACADRFFEKHPLIDQYRNKATEIWTLYLRNIAAHGTWNKKVPFEKSAIISQEAPIAVLTRATIKWNWLIEFWKYVPTSQKSLKQNPGLEFSIGVGEVPIFQMATFSLWKDAESVKNFAYKSHEHRAAIEKTRKNNWYKEELFSRFQVFKTTGQWNGILSPVPFALE
jgi:hypothetical protein